MHDSDDHFERVRSDPPHSGQRFVMRAGMQLDHLYADSAQEAGALLARMPAGTAVNVFDVIGSRNYLTGLEREDIARAVRQAGGDPALYRCLDERPR